MYTVFLDLKKTQYFVSDIPNTTVLLAEVYL